jgi:hypothetical protein
MNELLLVASCSFCDRCEVWNPMFLLQKLESNGLFLSKAAVAGIQCYYIYVSDENSVSLFGWLVLVCSERRVLLAGCWFVLREKSCWLVADKPSEQGA